MKSCVVIPNWNGRDRLGQCLESLSGQLPERDIIVVDNGSTDGSVEYVRSNFPSVQIVANSHNLGFSGGVNAGLRAAIEQGFDCVALLNNDAIAQKGWLSALKESLGRNSKVGIVASKILDASAGRLDSTGEQYSSWGLPFPRGRDEKVNDQYDSQTEIFAASGGASLYRVKMLKQIGLFDEDFFAYYEDVDISFRAQLVSWKIAYQPLAVVHHEIGETSRRIPGFTTYQTLKNLPQLIWKNVPLALMPRIFPRFVVAYLAIYLSAVGRGQFWPATKGLVVSILLWPKKLVQRRRIQSIKKVPAAYIASMLVHDLPPDAHMLRAVRRGLSLGRIK